MKRTTETLTKAIVAWGFQRCSPMHTGVDVGLDLHGLSARHNRRKMTNVVNLIVARFSNVLFTAGHLPNMRPQVFHLPRRIVFRRVMAIGNVLVAHKLIGIIEERLGRLR